MTPVRLHPVRLRCAHLDNPLGVAPSRVRFGWQLRDSGGDLAQAAFHIQVFPNELLSFSSDTAVWDSGQIASAECLDIPYAGSSLAPGGRYWWRVRVRSPSGAVSAWSSPATFEVELDPASWQASWIGLGQVRESFTPPSGDGAFDPVAESLRPAPYLRRSFTLDRPVASARLHVTALGLYEARLNGQRVGDAYLSPGWTDYNQRVLYQSYDVTSLISAGENVLGAVIADGWYAGFVAFNAKRAGAHYGPAPELLAQLVVCFTDGSREVIGTDSSWHGRFGAVRHADLLMGEKHDLSLEPAGWDAGSFAETGWRPVLVRELDGRPLVADPGPPVRVTEEIAATRVWRDASGRQLADFGQNLTGWVRLRVSAAAGTVITVRHGETLDSDGSLYTLNLRSARATDSYAVAGSPATLEPRFTLHGFRYAEISGCPADLTTADVTARVAHSDIPVTGSFASSEPWLDQLFRVVDWGQRGNFISVPTDCPQRDERLGWLGDAQVFARTACYNRDVAAFYAKWLDDVADAQHPSGAYPDIAPRLSIPWAGAPAWADAGVIVPWTMWKMYGDRSVLERHFGGMSRWMDFVARGNPDYLRSAELGNSYNDWLAPVDDHTPPALLATAYWAYDAALMAEISTVLGRDDEAADYRALREKIGAAFADAFVAADGSVASETQTAYTLALHMGLVPSALRSSTAAGLVAAIEAADWHLTTGFVGVGYLLPVLSSVGRDDVAYRLLAQRSLPSWRYMLDHGATTIWERWDGWSGSRGFQSAWMNSFNHYSLGSVAEWLYRFLLGIDQAPGSAGFRELELRPHPGGSLTFARGSYQSVRGLIGASWSLSDGQFSYQVSVPPNVTATVRMPGSPEAVYQVGPGTHSFSVPVPLMLDKEERP